MPWKGKAFVKPVVNYLYKASKQKQAQLYAAADESSADELLKEINKIVTDGNLPSDRETDALIGIKHAVKRLRAGADPEGELRPPPDCLPCKSGKHVPHRFPCMKRKDPPRGEEGMVKKRVHAKLRHEWRAKLYEIQTVSTRASTPRTLLASSFPEITRNTVILLMFDLLIFAFCNCRVFRVFR